MVFVFPLLSVRGVDCDSEKVILRVACLQGWKRVALCGALAIALPGCANLARMAAWEAAGWHRGWVHAMMDWKDLKAGAVVACDSVPPTDLTARSRYAVVRYWKGGRFPQTLVVRAPESLELHVGDAVEINVRDCRLSMSQVAH